MEQEVERIERSLREAKESEVSVTLVCCLVYVCMCMFVFEPAIFSDIKMSLKGTNETHKKREHVRMLFCLCVCVHICTCVCEFQQNVCVRMHVCESVSNEHLLRD